MQDIPLSIIENLNVLRECDKQSKDKLIKISEDEKSLLDLLASSAKNDPLFDEIPLLDEYQALLTRRQKISVELDDQMKRVQMIYDSLDKKISAFDSQTRSIVHLFPQINDEVGSGEARRKKKRKSASSEVRFPEQHYIDAAQYDPNEPVYCTCRQVSYGNMIACENPECIIEWFHFKCVDLVVEPTEPWYCQSCRTPTTAKTTNADGAEPRESAMPREESDDAC